MFELNHLPKGIFNRSCSFLNAWSTIQRVMFSVSSAGTTTLAAAAGVDVLLPTM